MHLFLKNFYGFKNKTENRSCFMKCVKICTFVEIICHIRYEGVKINLRQANYYYFSPVTLSNMLNYKWTSQPSKSST